MSASWRVRRTCLAGRADQLLVTSEMRLRRDVDALCPTPRHRDVPGSLQAARAHCREQLEEAGWTAEERVFRPRPAPRLSDAGHPVSPLAMRWTSDLEGVNLLATPPGHPGHRAGDVLLMAHLDTVRCSTGADDNASGVAVTLEVARQLRGRDHRVVIALVDLEELWHLGSRELARTLPRPGLVVCLDAVGFFDERPRTQRLPAGLGLRFPALARQLRMNEHRGNFLLAVHRRSSAVFAASGHAQPPRPVCRQASCATRVGVAAARGSHTGSTRS